MTIQKIDINNEFFESDISRLHNYLKKSVLSARCALITSNAIIKLFNYDKDYVTKILKNDINNINSNIGDLLRICENIKAINNELTYNLELEE